MGGFSRRVYALVRQIPPGQVATYGQLALLLGNPRMSRAVGTALSACRDDSVPCHRVVSRLGGLSNAFAPLAGRVTGSCWSWRPSPSPRRATWTCPGASGLDRHEGQSYIILTICPFSAISTRMIAISRFSGYNTPSGSCQGSPPVKSYERLGTVCLF